MNLPALVSPEWLHHNLDDPALVILDATLAKPKSTGKVLLEDKQIPGARFFDIDYAFSDQSIPLPHMICNASQFEQAARQLGITKDSKVVVYDQHGIYSSPRAWWMLRSMGHENTTVLNGGLPEWIGSGYPTEPKQQTQTLKGDFEAHFSDLCFVDAAFVAEKINDPNIQVLDARSRGRFNGTEPEPREGLRGGHIPHSISLPFTEVLDGYRIKSESELKQLLKPLDLQNKKLVFSCGSGLTACIILLAAFMAGYDDLAVYDGSWSEWGQPGELPVVM